VNSARKPWTEYPAPGPPRWGTALSDIRSDLDGMQTQELLECRRCSPPGAANSPTACHQVPPGWKGMGALGAVRLAARSAWQSSGQHHRSRSSRPRVSAGIKLHLVAVWSAHLRRCSQRCADHGPGGVERCGGAGKWGPYARPVSDSRCASSPPLADRRRRADCGLGLLWLGGMERRYTQRRTRAA
jgi:hypothetical protein